MDTKQERVGIQAQYISSRECDIRQISCDIDMHALRARVMGQDPLADSVLQEAIAKRDQVLSDLSALAKAPSSQWANLRARIDLEIDDLEKITRTMTNAQSR